MSIYIFTLVPCDGKLRKIACYTRLFNYFSFTASGAINMPVHLTLQLSIKRLPLYYLVTLLRVPPAAIQDLSYQQLVPQIQKSPNNTYLLQKNRLLYLKMKLSIYLYKINSKLMHCHKIYLPEL